MRKVDGCCGLKTNGNRKKKTCQLINWGSIWVPGQLPPNQSSLSLLVKLQIFPCQLSNHCWWFRNQKKQTTWDVKKTCESWDEPTTFPSSGEWIPDFWLPSSSMDPMTSWSFRNLLEVKTLKTIMEENGHKHIDILKVRSGGYPWLGANFGLAWDAAGWSGFYFDVFLWSGFCLQRSSKGVTHTHGGETGTRTHFKRECSETSKFTSDHWPSRKVHDSRSSDFCLRPCRKKGMESREPDGCVWVSVYFPFRHQLMLVNLWLVFICLVVFCEQDELVSVALTETVWGNYLYIYIYINAHRIFTRGKPHWNATERN